MTRCRAVVVLWRLCTVGKVRLQQRSTMVVPRWPGLTCTGRTETLLSSGARHRIWANFDRRHSSPRARSDKMLTVWKSRLVHRKRLPCEPAAGWLVVDCRRDFFSVSFLIVPNTVLSFTHILRVNCGSILCFLWEVRTPFGWWEAVPPLVCSVDRAGRRRRSAAASAARRCSTLLPGGQHAGAVRGVCEAAG